MKNDKIDLKKVKSVYDIAGTWVWQYGRYQKQYTWDRFSYKNPVLVNTWTNEVKNIIKYLEVNNLELEKC